MEENLSARLYGKMDLRLETGAIPQPSTGEVLVRIKNCGICGTDLHMWSMGFGDDPLVIGHECSGVVTAVGPDVERLKVGDRVALELGLPCRKCDFCRRGRYNLCKPFSSGGLTRFHVYAEDFCHVIPENVSFEAGAMIEPLAVAVHALRRAGASVGKSVLICGAGSIGLCCLLVARALGASEICVTDVSSSRLQMAERLGANCTVLVDGQAKDGDDEDSRARRLADEIVRKMSSGGRPDCSVECSGVPASLQTAIYATKSGGVMTPVGLDPAEVQLPIANAATREVDIRGSFSYCNDYPAAISLVASGKVDTSPIVTTRFHLTNVLEAFHLAKRSLDGVVKIMIACD